MIDSEKTYDTPEWLHMCYHKPAYHPVEDALGLSHRAIWRELKHKAVDIVLTETNEPFEVRHRFDTYDPLCDSPDYALMHFYVKTSDYTDHFQPLLQEYFSNQRYQQIRFRYHQAGLLKTQIPITMVFLNPLRVVKIKHAIDSRFLIAQEGDQQKILRLWENKEDSEGSRYGWIFDYINLKIEPDFQGFLLFMLTNEFTPSNYFFYLFDKYKDIPIISSDLDWNTGKKTYKMANGDIVTLRDDDYWGTGYQISSTAITINDCKIEDFFVPANRIPSDCVWTSDYSDEPKVSCLPDYYLSYHAPYCHARDFPLHLIEHLPILKYDPPYIILDSSVKNTPFGMYFD